MFYGNHRPSYVKLSNPVRSIDDSRLKDIEGIEDIISTINKSRIRLPVLISDHFAGLIDGNDSVGDIVIPSKEEVEAYSRGLSDETSSLDTSGERDNLKAPGLQHKYGPTAVAIVSALCAGLCRFCFRKRMFMQGQADSNEAEFPNEKALHYLEDHKEINTLLLTGGDSLMLNNESIKELTDILAGPLLNHIRTVRFGSRITSFYPQRIDDELCSILSEFSRNTEKKVHVCTHFEHPLEISEEAKDAFNRMQGYGIGLYNQTVLLKDINDNPQTLYLLFETLVQYGVRPYYIFQDRPVLGSVHMQIPLNEGVRIYNEFMQMMTGIYKPRYAMSTPYGKMEIIGMNPENKEEIVLKQHSARRTEDTGRIIFYNIKENNPYWYEPIKQELMTVQNEQRKISA